MKLTIFSRLVIGYIIILSMAALANIYSIYQLRNVNETTRSVLEIDNRLLDLQKKLTDSLFSQMRYEKKCIVMKDYTLYDQFLVAKADFDEDLKRTFLTADSPRIIDLLNSVKQFQHRYQSLVGEEVENMKKDRSYNQTLYAEKKERNVNKAIDRLKQLGEYSKENTYSKIKQLDIAVAQSRSVALIMISVTLLLGILISIIITRTITKPLSVMKKKTQEIAEGNFNISLKQSDLPEIAELADAFNAMCERLEEVDDMKSDFLSVMSHELRTPLTSIKEGANLLLEGVGGEISERQRRLLNIIAEEDKRLVNLVNSLLDLSKMEAGMMSYNYKEKDIIPLIKGVLVEILPLAQAKKIKFKVDIGNELPSVKMDPEMISRALRNLIGNAVKFTPSGGLIGISTRLKDRWIEFSVSDTGPGIPEQDLVKIFDKYRQVRLPGSDQKKGTGLGLAIVKHIITAHGGKVWGENNPGTGSTFIFSLPV
jgi:two-component system sensor histidine kinase GlrK